MREISAFRFQLHLLGKSNGLHGNNVIAVFEQTARVYFLSWLV